MKLRTCLSAIAVATLAFNAFALSAEYSDWGRGPAQFLMTKEEAAKWKNISGDDDAKAFVALFWARRDATPDTPRNEFREEFERRVAMADKSFLSDKKRGALSDRGKVLILFGPPKKVEVAGGQRQAALPGMPGGGTTSSDTSAANPYAIGGSDETTAGQLWLYEGDDARALFGLARAQLRFVDRQGKSDFVLERGGPDVGSAQRKAITRSLAQPNLTVAPNFAAAAAPAAAMPVLAIPAPVQTELTTESLKAAVAEMKAAASNPWEKKGFVTWGEYVTADGESFIPVQLYVPKSAGLSATQSLTFFGVVQDEAGTNVVAFEEPAKLTASKEDLFVDRSLSALAPGKYRGTFGLAENGKPVSMASAEMQLAGTLDKTASAISPLILSNNVYPLAEAQRPNDPHAFGGLKVVPKGDRTFRPSDELWYFIELRNPGLTELAADAPATAVTPKLQIKIDVEGTETGGKKIKRPAPPREIDAMEIKGVPGHYGVGNAIPLATFKPGEYTFNVKVIDTIKKTSYTLSEKFTVIE
ncbi:MAG: GWxTD domain-containing protein [Acidobacteriota bacterium]|nr:GWxTD domain-containing protein [Acidobacteriota bacterium]